MFVTIRAYEGDRYPILELYPLWKMDSRNGYGGLSPGFRRFLCP